MSVTSIRIGLAGLGTAGRSLPQAVAKTTGFSFVAGADLREAAREQYRAEQNSGRGRGPATRRPPRHPPGLLGLRVADGDGKREEGDSREIPGVEAMAR